jgi:hypothetical protein
VVIESPRRQVGVDQTLMRGCTVGWRVTRTLLNPAIPVMRWVGEHT